MVFPGFHQYSGVYHQNRGVHGENSYYPDLHPSQCRQLPQDFTRMENMMRLDPMCLERTHYHMIPSMCFIEPAYKLANVTPIQNAIGKMHIKCVEYFINNGVILNRHEYQQNPLLLMALKVLDREKSYEMVKLLLERHVSPDLNNYEGENGITTCLNYAITFNLIDIVKILLDYNAVTEDWTLLQYDENYVTPLYSAFKKQHINICKLLFLNGAIMNPHRFKQNYDPNNVSQSILHTLVERMYFLSPESAELANMTEILELYYEFGGDMMVRKHGKTALEHLKTSFQPNKEFDWYGYDKVLEGMQCNPLSLKQLSRLTVINAMGRNCASNLSKLPLPKYLYNYLCFDVP